MSQSKDMVKLAVKALEDKKGEDVKIIDIQGVSILADYFIIAGGSNVSQVQPWRTTWRKSCLRLVLNRAR